MQVLALPTSSSQYLQHGVLRKQVTQRLRLIQKGNRRDLLWNKFLSIFFDGSPMVDI